MPLSVFPGGWSPWRPFRIQDRPVRCWNSRKAMKREVFTTREPFLLAHVLVADVEQEHVPRRVSADNLGDLRIHHAELWRDSASACQDASCAISPCARDSSERSHSPVTHPQ